MFGGNKRCLLYPKSPLRRHGIKSCGASQDEAWWNAFLWMCLVGNCKKRSGVTLCKLVEKSNCCEGDGVKAMSMVVQWKQELVWEWPHWGSWQHSLSSFVNSKPFDVIETEQGSEIERAKVSTSVKVQSSVMQCEIAAEWALSVYKCECVYMYMHAVCGEMTKFPLIAPASLL